MEDPAETMSERIAFRVTNAVAAIVAAGRWPVDGAQQRNRAPIVAQEHGGAMPYAPGRPNA